MADPKLAELLGRLKLDRVKLDKETLNTVLPLVSQYGAQTALLLARGYLGPVATQVERKDALENDGAAKRAATRDDGTSGSGKDDGSAAGQSDTETKKDKLSSGEVAILGMAVTKLLYEAGELALHNPQVRGEGKQPEFKLDAEGNAPAFSLAHVLAASKVWRERSAEADANAKLEAARAEQSAPARSQSTAAVASGSSLRTRTLAARADRYAQPHTRILATNYRVPR